MKKTILLVVLVIALIGANTLNVTVANGENGSLSLTYSGPEALACGDAPEGEEGNSETGNGSTSSQSWFAGAVDWVGDAAHNVSDALNLTGVSETQKSDDDPTLTLTDVCNGDLNLCTVQGSLIATMITVGTAWAAMSNMFGW